MAERIQQVFICGSDEDEYLPGPVEDLRHLGCAGHTPSPAGYVAWHAWAARMAKTHVQIRCPECDLWAIWVTRGTAGGGTNGR